MIGLIFFGLLVTNVIPVRLLLRKCAIRYDDGYDDETLSMSEETWPWEIFLFTMKHIEMSFKSIMKIDRKS